MEARLKMWHLYIAEQVSTYEKCVTMGGGGGGGAVMEVHLYHVHLEY